MDSAITMPGWNPVVLAGASERMERADANGVDYRVQVWRPESPPPPAGFPLLCVLDAEVTFARCAETLRTASRRTQATGIQPSVLVGIAQADALPASRWRDYTAGPSSDAAVHAGGGAAQFLHFLSQQVLPAIESAVPVDAARRGLLGHSLAGYFSVWVLGQQASPFSCCMAVSPSIWWDEPRLRESLGRGLPPAAGEQARRCYLAVGEWEEPPAPWQRQIAGDPAWRARRAERRMIGNVQELAALLRTRLSADAVQLDLLPGEDHLSALLPAMSRALRFFGNAA